MAVKGRYVTDKEYIVVQVFVGQPAEFPVVRERAVTLQPGREHFLEMAAYTVTTDQEAESLDVQYRSLYMSQMLYAGQSARPSVTFLSDF